MVNPCFYSQVSTCDFPSAEAEAIGSAWEPGGQDPVKDGESIYHEWYAMISYCCPTMIIMDDNIPIESQLIIHDNPIKIH